MKTHRRELTQRCADQELVVEGHKVKLSQVKRYMRRKGTIEARTASTSDTDASDARSLHVNIPSPLPASQTIPVRIDSPSSLNTPVLLNENPQYSPSLPSHAELQLSKPALSQLNSSWTGLNSHYRTKRLVHSEQKTLAPELDLPREGSYAASAKQMQQGGTDKGAGDSDPERDSKRQRLDHSPSSPEPSRLLACPYAKYDTARYSEKNIAEKKFRMCSSCYLATIPRLK